MRYQYLLIDNDNTLMDFSAAEAAAIRETLRDFSLPCDDATISLYSVINDSLWKALERGETTQEKLKTERFRMLLEQLHAAGDPEEIGAYYADRLGKHAELMPDAMDFLHSVYGKAKIALLTNGVGSIQRGRLALCPFENMLDLVLISGEIGISKPDPRIIDLALEKLGCTDKKQAVMIGDSLSSDIKAAKSAGIDSVWVHRNSEVKSLTEALALL